jgi:transposase
VTGRLRVREIDDDEGRRLVRIVRRGSGSVVTWRRAQMVLLSAQGMGAAFIAKVAFTSEDRVRDVIRNFNADGFSSLYPKCKGGRPPKFGLIQRREIKKVARTHPGDHGLPFSTWSLSKLAEFLVAEGVVDDISREGLRILLREEVVTFQRPKTWKASKGPHYAEKKARVEQLYAIADRETAPQDGDPEVIFCVDEFGPLNLQPRPGRQWAAVSGKGKEPGRAPRRRMRASYHRTEGVRHLLAACELGEDKLLGHVKPRKTRTRFLEFCRCLRSLYPVTTRIAIICDNYSPHLTTARDNRVGAWAAARNVEIACTPSNASWLNRIEAQFTALRYFALDGTDHATRKEQASMIRRYIIWRNNHAYDLRLRCVVDRANAAGCALGPDRQLAFRAGHADDQSRPGTGNLPCLIVRIRGNGKDGALAEREVESAVRGGRSRGQLVWPQGKERAETASFSRVKRVLGSLGPQRERRLDDDLHFAHLKARLMVDANEVHITQGQVQASVSSYDPALQPGTTRTNDFGHIIQCRTTSIRVRRGPGRS